MRYVILRDDDTNALTPVECLESLYRPFLSRNLPVNLAVIPRVRTDSLNSEGATEGFLFARQGTTAPELSLAANPALIRYLWDNPGFRILQHGCDHSLYEFASERAEDVALRLEQGAAEFPVAGFARPETFVAPYDRFSRASLFETARRFRVISGGWFELRRLPMRWWSRYALKKMLKRRHWRIGTTTLLTHPGCLLSYRKDYGTMLDCVKRNVGNHHLTVLVTHWWEYFRGGKPDGALRGILHDTAEWLANQPDLRVISFADLIDGKIPLN